jgi:hypothetical protein
MRRKANWRPRRLPNRRQSNSTSFARSVSLGAIVFPRLLEPPRCASTCGLGTPPKAPKDPPWPTLTRWTPTAVGRRGRRGAQSATYFAKPRVTTRAFFLARCRCRRCRRRRRPERRALESPQRLRSLTASLRCRLRRRLQGFGPLPRPPRVPNRALSSRWPSTSPPRAPRPHGTPRDLLEKYLPLVRSRRTRRPPLTPRSPRSRRCRPPLTPRSRRSRRCRPARRPLRNPVDDNTELLDQRNSLTQRNSSTAVNSAFCFASPSPTSRCRLPNPNTTTTFNRSRLQYQGLGRGLGRGHTPRHSSSKRTSTERC